LQYFRVGPPARGREQNIARLVQQGEAQVGMADDGVAEFVGRGDDMGQ